MDIEDNYYLVPKSLISDDFYSELSPEAILIYVILKDKLKEAPAKGWVDKNGDVYLNYKIADLQSMFGYGNTKIIRLMRSLENCNLIERQRVDIVYGYNYNLPYMTYINEVWQ